MRKYLFFIITLLFFANQMVMAQKRALQQDECELWRTIRDPKISEDGRWITYRYSFLYKDDKSDLYLYDSKRDKTTALKNVTEFFFFGSGKWAKMVQQTPLDSTGQTVDSTFMVRLQDWKKIYWDKAAFPNVNVASASIVYTEPMEEQGKTSNRLIVWNVETGEETSIDHVGTYTLFNNRKTLIYEYKGDDATSLRVQDLKGKPREIFRLQKGIFGGCSFDEQKQAGTFTVASDSSRQYEPDLLYAFSLSPLSCRLVMNFREIAGIPEEMKISSRPYPLINGGRDIMVEVEPLQMPRPQPRVKPDRGFELELWTWNEPLSHRRQRPSRGGFNVVDYPKFVYHTDTKTCVKLADPGIERFVVPENDEYEYIFAIISKPYLTQYDWLHELNSDVYLIRLADGK